PTLPLEKARTDDLDVLVLPDHRVEAVRPRLLEGQRRQPGHPEDLARVDSAAPLLDELAEQLPVGIEAEPGEDRLARDLGLRVADVRPTGNERAADLDALLDRLLDRRRQRATVVRPDVPRLVLLGDQRVAELVHLL